MNGSADIFTEIKKLRSCKPVTATSMDGIKKDIPGHFKNIYTELYNSVDDKDKLNDLASDIEDEINFTHISHVNRVTPEVVKEAAKHLKDNKTDPIYSFSSDSVKHSPDVLFEKLATAFK